jgi:hypothetical protein
MGRSEPRLWKFMWMTLMLWSGEQGMVIKASIVEQKFLFLWVERESAHF